MQSILDLKVGEKGRVVSYSSKNIPIRMCEMGLLPGTLLEMKSKTFMNSTCCIGFCGNRSKIALRKSEAEFLLVEKI